MRPTDADFVRAMFSVNGSSFEDANRPDAQALGVDATQTLSDNSQTVTWLHQLNGSSTLDIVAYRRAADADAGRVERGAAGRDPGSNPRSPGDQLGCERTSGRNRLKAGVQYDRSPVVEHFRMTGLDAPFTFDGDRAGQNVGLFIQDSLQPVPDLHMNVGIRLRLLQAPH